MVDVVADGADSGHEGEDQHHDEDHGRDEGTGDPLIGLEVLCGVL